MGLGRRLSPLKYALIGVCLLILFIYYVSTASDDSSSLHSSSSAASNERRVAAAYLQKVNDRKKNDYYLNNNVPPKPAVPWKGDNHPQNDDQGQLGQRVVDNQRFQKPIEVGVDQREDRMDKIKLPAQPFIEGRPARVGGPGRPAGGAGAGAGVGAGAGARVEAARDSSPERGLVKEPAANRPKLGKGDLSGMNPPLPKVIPKVAGDESDDVLDKANASPQELAAMLAQANEEDAEMAAAAAAAEENEDYAAGDSDRNEILPPARKGIRRPAKVLPVVLEDDLVDALDLQSNKRKGRVGGKKVGMINPAAVMAAAKERKIAADSEKDKHAAGKWDGGWSQRFKQKPVGVAGENDHLNPADGENDELSGLLTHPLIARFAAFDFSSTSKSRSPITSPAKSGEDEDDDSFQAHPADGNAAAIGQRTRVDLSSQMYNVTLCALVPSEQRFREEWLLYHRILGVERFALYDTSAAGASGAAEIDGVADKMELEGKGEMGPSAEEIKANVGQGVDGLDEEGKVRSDRYQGLESWIEQGVVMYHWMKFADSKKAETFHNQMIQHCTATYSPSSNWLAHLDIDEFLVMSEPLYGPNSPYNPPKAANKAAIVDDVADRPRRKALKVPFSPAVDESNTWQYPLHDLLARSLTAEAACIPIPQLRYRNLGVRTLQPHQSLLEMQTKRDVVKHGNLPVKTLIHTSYTKGFVIFEGPHSCRVDPTTEVPKGLSREIRNSQGGTIQTSGTYQSTRLPTEPLAIAHYVQRDLSDCHQKLANLDDPNSIHPKGRGSVLCEEHYLPSVTELASDSFKSDSQNRFLLRTPPEGTVIEDNRIRDSWSARASKELLTHWRKKSVASLRTKLEEKVAQAAARNIVILSF